MTLVSKKPQAADIDPAVMSIHDLFEEQVRRGPHATAVTYGEQSLTYAELDRRANQLAHRLREWVRPESLVGLLTERSLEMVVGILAILKAGAAYVPVDPAYPKDRQQFMLSDSKVNVLLTQERFREQLDQYNGPVLYLDEDSRWSGTTDKEFVGVRVYPDNAAYVIYTSGSTGWPKGVVVTHGNVLRLMRETERWYKFCEHDVWTMFHSYGFDFSVWEIWGALLYGGRLVVVPYWVSRSPEEFLELVIREKVTVLNQTPSAFRQFICADEKRSELGKSALRYVIFGGEALDFSGLRLWMQRHSEHSPRLVNMYGITETTVHVTYRPVCQADVEESGLGSRIGIPIPDLQVHVLDAEMKPATQGVAGEMYAGGLGLARGYLNRPELTAERFVPDPFSPVAGQRLYRTGDRARIIDNEFEYLGRGDHQVKIRGFRIELGEIEGVLAQQEDVRESAVLVEEDQHGDRILVAYVVTARAVTKKQLRNYLEKCLPDYMVPAKIVMLDKLPLTENGKLDRRRLTEETAALSNGPNEEEYVAPRNELEQSITNVWAELLGVERLGIHDKFFDHGGHSLQAMQMTSRMRELLGVNVSVKDIFEFPTPAALAHRAIALLHNEIPAQAEPLVRRNLSQAPLSFAQRTGWFLNQVMPKDAFPMPLAHRIEGELDFIALERSVTEIILRLDILRTRFVEIGGEPFQVIEPALTIKIQREDLSRCAVDQRDTLLKTRLHEEGRCGFDLGRLPLFRICVFQMGTEDQVILITMHHIIADGWSMKIFYRELEILYGAYRRNEHPALAETAVQYADYAWWQKRRFENGDLKRGLSYWRTQLAGAPEVLRLPVDSQARESMSYTAVNERFNLDNEATQALRDLSRHAGVTFYMMLLSVCAVLLHRYSGEEDILISTPIVVRTHEHLQGVMGIFLNMVMMRIDLSGNPAFTELVKRVRETALAAYAHHELPLERVVQDLRPHPGAWRNVNRTPLSQIMFNMLDADDRALNLPGLRATHINVDDGAAKFDLTFEIQDQKSHLHVRIVHRAELFAEGTGQDIRLRFEQLVDEILKKADRPIGDLDVSLPLEKTLTSENNSMTDMQE